MLQKTKSVLFAGGWVLSMQMFLKAILILGKRCHVHVHGRRWKKTASLGFRDTATWVN